MPAKKLPPAAPVSPPRPRARRLPDWRVLPAPAAELEATVIVPVKDEARRLPATLRALASQCDADGRPLDPRRFEIIVLANNCDDASAEVVRRFAARRPALRLFVVEARFPKAVAHVGHARACLMNEACRRLLRNPRGGGVIASTDGDTRVAPDWLAATLAEVGAGAEAVGGRIVMDDDATAPAGLARFTRRDADYQRLRVRLEHALDPDPADPWPRHHQHFGASLAITTRAYVQVGGLPAEPFLEDEALYQTMLRHDIKVRHSERVEVLTSNRRHGRVEVGLSWQLREWAALAKTHREAMVHDPVAWAGDIALRRRLRRLWQAQHAAGSRSAAHAARVAAIAAKLGVSAHWLARNLRAGVPFGAVWAEALARRAQASKGRAPAPVSLGEAISALRDLLAKHRRPAPARAGRADTARGASRPPA